MISQLIELINSIKSIDNTFITILVVGLGFLVILFALAKTV